MEIQTSNFGPQNINENEILSFPEGMIGFAELTEFKLFHEEGTKPTVYWLQSTTEPEFMMSIISPAVLGLEYRITLTDEEVKLLELDDTSDANVVLAVYKQHEKKNEQLDIKAIAKAPIIINPKAQKGIQKSLTSIEIIED
jgi:flagellar assembly factor FliW